MRGLQCFVSVKFKIINHIKTKPCCKASFLYGFFLFSTEFSDKTIKFNVENTSKVDLILSYTEQMFNIKREEVEIEANKKYIVVNIQNKNLEIIKDYFGLDENDDENHRILKNIECNDCLRAFFSGAFYASGTINDPLKGYHFEVKHKNTDRLRTVLNIMQKNGFPFKEFERNKIATMYLKESEQIEDILTFIYASNSSLQLMDTKIFKGIRNKVNRAINCETANINRTVLASSKQVEDIKYIVDTKGWDYIPDDLINIALVRFENPELSLAQLGANLFTPLSKTAINNRLKRLAKIANDIRNEDSI